MDKRRNLKRAIAKFEELAADDDYVGNSKIINLDAFLKGDLKSKKKKKKEPTADHLESTPLKGNKNERQLSDSFDDQSENSSNEIKTADQFLKQFLSQPALVTDDTMKKKTPAKNKSTSGSFSTKQTSISKQPTKSSAKKSTTSSSKSSVSNKSVGNKSTASNRTTGDRSAAKSVQSRSISKQSNRSNQFASRTTPQLTQSKKKVQKDGDLKLKEREKQFLQMLQNRSTALEDEEEYDLDEDEEDDEDEENDESETEPDEESLDENETLDDESIDPEDSELIDEQQLRQLRGGEQQEFDDESISDERRPSHEEFVDDESDEEQQLHHSVESKSANYLAYRQPSAKLYEQRKQHDLVKYNPAKPQNSGRTLCRVQSPQQPAGRQSVAEYVLNIDYQRSATEELYGLIQKSGGQRILTKLIQNIKRTLNQDELPDPARVRPFFHFTPDNEIHVTFVFINPTAVYYNPWDVIISTNYADLSILFEKIYLIIFEFDIRQRQAHGQA